MWEQAGPFDAVLNLAARAGVRQSLENPWIYFETNTSGTLNLLEMCRHRGVPKLVLASTSSLYGSRNPVPYSEQADTNHPLSPYAASKKAGEALCHSYHHLYGIVVTVVRYFTVYGPAGRPDMSLFRFVQWVSEQRPVWCTETARSRATSPTWTTLRGGRLRVAPSRQPLQASPSSGVTAMCFPDG